MNQMHGKTTRTLTFAGATKRAFAVVSLLAISACSGGGGRTQAALPLAPTDAKLSGSSLATLRIVIPARPASTSSAGRRAAYISYATQSIKAVFTPTGGGSATTFNQNLTPTSPGCQSNLNSSVTCTLQLPGLAPHNYTASFTLYDGMLNGSNIPTGNVLSANQSVPVTITAGQPNVIAVTLGGVPVTLAIAPGGASTISGNQGAGYTVSRCLGFEPASTESLTVVGVDADGNFILGPGAPTPALSSSDTSMAAVAAPPPSSPNRFTLSRAQTRATVGTSFNLTASVTPVAGSGSTTPISTVSAVTFVIDNCGVVTTLAGSSAGFADATGTAAQFNGPLGVAVDGSDNVYVGDAGNNRIRKITALGVVTTLAGSSTGAAGSADGQGSSAQFDSPFGVAVDGSSNVYVADLLNNSIRKITSGGLVSTLAGGSSGYSDGQGNQAKFHNPYDVALDGSGNVYVSDQGNDRIRKITSGGLVSTLAGSSIGGSADGQGGAAQFNSPVGVALDGNGNVYVGDENNNRIRKITPGGFVTTLAGSSAGFADAPSGPGSTAQFNDLVGVAVDGSGNAYVADRANNRIRKITPSGFVTTLAGSATAGSADGVGSAAQFNHPFAVAVDGSGNVYVADQNNNRIRVIQ